MKKSICIFLMLLFSFSANLLASDAIIRLNAQYAELRQCEDIVDISPSSIPINSGATIYIDNMPRLIAFRVRRGNQLGFITSARGVYRHNAPVRLGNPNGHHIGYVQLNNIARSADALFVPLESGFHMTNSIYAVGGILGATPYPPSVGSAVMSVNGTNMALNRGRVTNVNVMVLINGNSILASGVDFTGESDLVGGLVFSMGLGTELAPVGMIIDWRTYTNRVLFVPSSRINAALATTHH